jgi:hypothetical protein
MLTLSGNTCGYMHDTYTPKNSTTERHTHRLSVATAQGTVTVLVPHELHQQLMAVPEGRLLSVFGTVVELTGTPDIDFEYGKPKGGAIRATDFAAITEVQLTTAGANGSKG